MKQHRIASLLASGTEIAAALLGIAPLHSATAGDLGIAPSEHAELVGISHECDYPAWIKALPVLTESSIHHAASSEKIHEEVQDKLMKALSLYRVKTDALEAVKPTVVITQEQCKVCAVSLDDVKTALKTLVHQSIEIISLSPTSLSEIFNDVKRIAAAVGREEEGERLTAWLNRRIQAVQDMTAEAGCAGGTGRPPRVAFIEWIDPVFIGGNWMPELIELAGGAAVLGRNGAHSEVYSIEKIAAEEPDVICISPCGFKLDQTKRDLYLLTQKPEWKAMRAVREGRVFLLDGNELFNRSSYRIVDSLEVMAAALCPERFPSPPPNYAERMKSNERS